MEDYAKLLKNGLDSNKDFYHGVWKTEAKSYKEATRFLTGKYATDKDYHKKLNALIKTYDLTYYDKEKQPLNQWNQISQPIMAKTMTPLIVMLGATVHNMSTTVLRN